MKIAIKNFLTTLKRYRTASVLNITGLTIAFIAFYILMAQVYYAATYNWAIPDNDRVYFITHCSDTRDEEYSEWSERPFTQRIMQDCSAVEHWGFVDVRFCEPRVWIKQNDELTSFNVDVSRITPQIMDISGMKLLQGSKEDFQKPNTLFISASTAKLLGVGLGDDIRLPQNRRDAAIRPGKAYMVAGIFEDFPQNTNFEYLKIITALVENNNSDKGIYTYHAYVKLYNNCSPEKFESMWNDERRKPELIELKDGRSYHHIRRDAVKIVSLKDLYYSQRLESKMFVIQGDKREHITQFAIAMLIIIIAFINFVNFFMVMIPRRLRVVNISKVFGATNRSLRWSFLFEALALTLISLGLALYLMIAIKDTFIADYVTCSLRLADNLQTIGVMLAILVVMALVAAFYPAWYITSFNPSLAVKGGFAGSVSGRRLRIALIGVQFTISMVLIITTIAFFLQYRHLTKYDIGFQTDNIIEVQITDWQFRLKGKGESFISELKTSANVVDVTAGGPFFDMGRLNIVDIDDKKVSYQMRNVRYNYFDFFKIPITLGRDFTPEDEESFNVICNKVAADMKEKEVEMFKNKGQTSYYDVIGVLDDRLMLCSLNEEQKPVMYVSSESRHWYVYFIRLHPSVDVEQFNDFLRQKIDEFGIDAEKYRIRAFKDTIDEQYANTRKQTILLSLFSVVSIVISLMGVFGIVIFETQYRRREIAVRRVFGATTSGLLLKFNLRYALIVGACFLMATPVAYYIISEWQKDFAHKANIGWWVYVGAFALVMLITLLLITYRSYRAASENPAQVVKEN